MQKHVARINELHPPNSIGAIVSRIPRDALRRPLAHKEGIHFHEDLGVSVSLQSVGSINVGLLLPIHLDPLGPLPSTTFRKTEPPLSQQSAEARPHILFSQFSEK